MNSFCFYIFKLLDVSSIFPLPAIDKIYFPKISLSHKVLSVVNLFQIKKLTGVGHAFCGV